MRPPAVSPATIFVFRLVAPYLKVLLIDSSFRLSNEKARRELSWSPAFPSPYSYLMTRRIERAKALLRRGDMSVTDACFAVGFTSLGSFSSRFTELAGESPSAYRARSHPAAAVIPACVIKVMTRPIRNEEAATPHHS